MPWTSQFVPQMVPSPKARDNCHVTTRPTKYEPNIVALAERCWNMACGISPTSIVLIRAHTGAAKQNQNDLVSSPVQCAAL